jgi:hypothetical protein
VTVSWTVLDKLDKANAGTEKLRKMWVKLELQPTAVKGKVVDAARNTGIVMAEVRMKGSGERTFSDAEGHFILSPVQPSQNRRVLQAFAQGYEPAEEEVLVAGVGQSYHKEMRLERRRA